MWYEDTCWNFGSIAFVIALALDVCAELCGLSPIVRCVNIFAHSGQPAFDANSTLVAAIMVMYYIKIGVGDRLM